MKLNHPAWIHENAWTPEMDMRWYRRGFVRFVAEKERKISSGEALTFAAEHLSADAYLEP